MSKLDDLRNELRALNVNIVTTLDDKSLPAAERGHRARKLADQSKAVEAQIGEEEHLAGQRGRAAGMGDIGGSGGGFALGHDGTRTRTFGTGGMKAFGVTRPVGQAPPIAFDDAQLARLYEACVDGKSVTIEGLETKATLETNAPMTQIPEFRQTPVGYRREPTRVADLLPSSPTGASEVDYFQITTPASAAAAVAEGATKPLSTLVYAKVAALIKKIAHYVEVSDETLSDYTAFLSVVQEELLAGLALAENDELLNGLGTGAHITGLLATSGILTQAKASDTALDAISKATTALRAGTSYAEADGLVINPTDWQGLTLSKDTTGKYLLGDPSAQTAPQLWGLKTVVTTQIPAGTALVGAFMQAGEVFVRWAPRIETANQGTTQFTNNTTLVRCEERLGLAVYRPTCLCKVTGL